MKPQPENSKQTASGKPYDIRERTFLFARRVIQVTKRVPGHIAGEMLMRQLIRAGTSIGANVEEADGASSKRDFRNKMAIARKEARETRYWLRLAHTELGLECRELIEECSELILILSKIVMKSS